MKTNAAPQARYACIEEEMAEKLNILGVMFDHFGWDKARDHVVAARGEILKIMLEKDS